MKRAIDGNIPPGGIGMDADTDDGKEIIIPDGQRQRVHVCLGVLSYSQLDHENKIDHLRRVIRYARRSGIDVKVLVTHRDTIGEEEYADSVQAQVADMFSLNRRDVFIRTNYCDNSLPEYREKSFAVDKVSYQIMDALLASASDMVRRLRQ